MRHSGIGKEAPHASVQVLTVAHQDGNEEVLRTLIQGGVLNRRFDGVADMGGYTAEGSGVSDDLNRIPFDTCLVIISLAVHPLCISLAEEVFRVVYLAEPHRKDYVVVDLRLEGLAMQDDGEIGGLILHPGAVNQLTHLDHSLISRRGLRDVANYAYCRHISLRLVGKVGLTEGITEDSDGGKE